MRMTSKRIQEAVQDFTSRSCLPFLYTKKGETYVLSSDEVLCQIAHLVLYSAHTPSILDVLSLVQLSNFNQYIDTIIIVFYSSKVLKLEI